MKTGLIDSVEPNSRIAGLPRTYWLGLLLALGVVAAYWPVFSAGFIWDDDAYVTENKLLTEPDGLWRIWFTAHSQSQYFPLVFTTLRLEHSLWGLNPLGYHVVNVCLHIINALLVWELLRRLTVPGAWLAAAIFALHPVQVETVAWVTELKNTESTMLYLLAIFSWLEFCKGRGQWFYLLALALQLLALFAKTTACTLPAAMILVLWLTHQPVNWRRIVQVIPFLMLGFSMGLLSVWWEKHLGNYAPKLHLLGGPVDRVLIATHALWFYAGKIFWPMGLTFSYPRWKIDAGNPSQYIWLFSCIVAGAVVWIYRRRLGTPIVGGLIFFVAALSPMLGFIPLYTFYYSYVADHYQYFACLGLIAISAGVFTIWFEKMPALRLLRVPAAGALLLCLGILTWRQCGIYHDVKTLWNDTLQKNPASWMAHVNLGRLLAQKGEVTQAEIHYQSALAINPNEESIYYNYGNLLARNGRLEDAIEKYHQALQIAPGKAEAHNNLGIVLNHLHRPDEAIKEYESAISLQPDYADAYFNLGNALSAEHKMDEAVAAYLHAVQLNPDSDMFRKRLQALTTPVAEHP